MRQLKVVLAVAAALVALCLSAAAQPHGSWPPMGSQGHHHGGHLGHPMPHNRVAYAPLRPLHSFAPGQQPIVPSGGLPVGNWHNGIGLNGNLPFGSMPSGNMNNGIGVIGSVPNGYMPTGNVQSGYVPNTNVMNGNGLNDNWVDWCILYRNRVKGIRPNGNGINGNLINGNQLNGFVPNRNWMNGNSLKGYVLPGTNVYLPNGNIQSRPLGKMYNGYTQNGMIPNGNWLYGPPATIYHPNWKDTNIQKGIWQNGNMPYVYLQNAMSGYNALPYGSIRSNSDGNEDETTKNVDTPEASTPNPESAIGKPAGDGLQAEGPNKGAPNQGATSDDGGITKKPDDLQQKPSGAIPGKVDALEGAQPTNVSVFSPNFLDIIVQEVLKKLKESGSTEAPTTKDVPATTTNPWPGVMQDPNPRPISIPFPVKFRPQPQGILQSRPQLTLNPPNYSLNSPPNVQLPQNPIIPQPYPPYYPPSPSAVLPTNLNNRGW